MVICDGHAERLIADMEEIKMVRSIQQVLKFAMRSAKKRNRKNKDCGLCPREMCPYSCQQWVAISSSGIVNRMEVTNGVARVCTCSFLRACSVPVHSSILNKMSRCNLVLICGGWNARKQTKQFSSQSFFSLLCGRSVIHGMCISSCNSAYSLPCTSHQWLVSHYQSEFNLNQ